MKTISAVDLRSNLRDILDNVTDEDPIIVFRGKLKKTVVIITEAEYRKFTELKQNNAHNTRL